jgi:hypothetical protein
MFILSTVAYYLNSFNYLSLIATFIFLYLISVFINRKINAPDRSLFLTLTDTLFDIPYRLKIGPWSNDSLSDFRNKLGDSFEYYAFEANPYLYEKYKNKHNFLFHCIRFRETTP